MTTKRMIFEEVIRPKDEVSHRKLVTFDEDGISISMQTIWPDNGQVEWEYDPTYGGSIKREDAARFHEALTKWLEASQKAEPEIILKPCPGCDSTASLLEIESSFTGETRDNDPHEVKCDNCQLYAFGTTKESAIKAWNTRVTEPPPRRNYNEYSPRLRGAAARAAQDDPNKPENACCNREERGPNGGCANCGHPCF